MSLEYLLSQLEGVISIKKDGHVVFQQNHIYEPNVEYTSCKKSHTGELELKQEGDK